MAEQISFKIDPASLAKMEGFTKAFLKGISSTKMQVHRATKYVEFTKDLVMKGGANLKPISSATKILSGEHDPEYFTGTLLDQMKVKAVPKINAADAGYFEKGSLKAPSKGEMKLTYTQLAILQHTGFRIPRDDDPIKRKKILGFFFSQGLTGKGEFEPGRMKSSGKFWTIPARPFMYKSIARFVESGEDIKATDEYIDKLLKSIGQ